jgi:hypothetical protein
MSHLSIRRIPESHRNILFVSSLNKLIFHFSVVHFFRYSVAKSIPTFFFFSESVFFFSVFHFRIILVRCNLTVILNLSLFLFEDILLIITMFLSRIKFFRNAETKFFTCYFVCIKFNNNSIHNRFVLRFRTPDFLL